MSRPWMPLYVETFITKTDHLGAAETGAYMALVMYYWVNRKLPQSDRALARIARMTMPEWEEHRESIASFFNEDWTHDRVEEELRKSDEAYEKRAKAGQKGGKSSKTPSKPKPRSSNASGNGSSDASAKPNLKLEQNTSISNEIEGRQTPEKQLFDRGKQVLGANAGGLINKVLQKHDGNVPLARATIETASTKSDPKEWLGGVIRAGPRGACRDGAVSLLRKLEDDQDDESYDYTDGRGSLPSKARSTSSRYEVDERDRDQHERKSFDLVPVSTDRH